MTAPARPERPGNHLLASLPPDEFERLRPHLENRIVNRREVLQAHGQVVRRVYFPNGGVFSVTRPLPDGTLVEAASVGREGFLGIEACVGADAPALGQTFLQVPDGSVSTLGVGAFRRELETRRTLHALVGRYLHTFVAATMQAAVCNALHAVHERCARWLLLTHDRMHRGEFRLSHEALAIMIGSSRSTVTAAALGFQQAGLIAYRHGRVQVLDRAGLESVSCVCYRMLRAQLDWLATGRRSA